MKRIIKIGNYNKITCPTCECVFSFDPTDIEKSGENKGKVLCPQCGAPCERVVKTAD